MLILRLGQSINRLQNIPTDGETAMSPRDRIVEGVRELLEKQYLESVGDQCGAEYARLSDSQQRAVLKAFLGRLTAGAEPEQWAMRLQDIL
jgi:hypothetical protein